MADDQTSQPESVADLAISWPDTIRLETERDEPDCAGRVRSLISIAMYAIHVREHLLQDKA